jgi:hypothetical protein
MRLMNARLCLDCEEVHEAQHCPICGSESFAFLTRWVTPSDTVTTEAMQRASRPPDPIDRREPPERREPAERREQLDRREQVDAYRQILNPEAPQHRGRLVARGALGLALLGVARMVWRATPETRADSKSEPPPNSPTDAP